MTRTDALARPSPHLAPVPAPSACAIADEAYRLAVCLLDDDGAAAALLTKVVGAVRPLRLGHATPAVRAVVLRRLIAGARAARVGRTVAPSRPARTPLPELQALPTAEREVLALALACGLCVGDAARVLRIDATHARALRRTAHRHVVAFGRAGAGSAPAAERSR